MMRFTILSCEKSKDDRDDWQVPLVRKPITLIEKNQKGFRISTCIIEETDNINIRKLKSNNAADMAALKKPGKLVYDLLKTTFHGLCGSKEVLLQHAKPFMEEKGYDPDSARKYVTRGLKELVDANEVIINDKGMILLNTNQNDPFKGIDEE